MADLNSRINALATAVGTDMKGKANVNHTHTAAQITEDTNNRFVTDAEKAAWNSSDSKPIAYAIALG